MDQFRAGTVGSADTAGEGGEPVMVMILALGAALAYGAADFLGGAATRRANVLKILLISVPVGLTAIVIGALATGSSGGGPTWPGMLWGFASGLAGGTGLIMFYRALAQGPMSVVAPVSALAAAILPIAAGVLRGERLDALVMAGVLLCLLAVGMVSMEDGDRTAGPANRPVLRRVAASGPVMAAVSGVGFGIFFVLLKQAGPDSGLWPLVASRSAGLGVVIVALLVGGRHGRGISGRATLGLAVLSGLLDAAANALYYYAVHAGLLSLAAVLTSLYPAVTVLLARMVYSERLRPVQQAGMAVAIAGVALVTVG